MRAKWKKKRMRRLKRKRRKMRQDPSSESDAESLNKTYQHVTIICSHFNLHMRTLRRQTPTTVFPRSYNTRIANETNLHGSETRNLAVRHLPGLIPIALNWNGRLCKLDPEIYGQAESAITTKIIEQEIKGAMIVEEAMKRKKLFVLDYYDLYLPYVQKVRKLEGTTLYGSRTLFFLTEGSILRPIAIELTRPKMGDQPQWRHVYTLCWDASRSWLQRFAKAHTFAHDIGSHQLVVHWLRTHGCTELYIITANRQLSALHPVFRLLLPHFRYTMEINALARDALVNADGIIESCFFSRKIFN